MSALDSDRHDPRTLRVGDRVRFVSLPRQWDAPEYRVDAEDVDFLQLLISRRRPCRVARVDEFGYPWIDARTRDPDGKTVYHSWRIAEWTGWRRVVPRSTRK